MPRPISWLPRLHEIRKTVANSVRSHYDRRDLEGLFQLQPRAAQKLLEMLPGVQIGTSRLVEREALSGFLDRVHNAEDTTGLFEQMRQEKTAGSRRKIRSLVRRDIEPVSLTSLPNSVGLSRGRLEVSFKTVKQRAEAMYAIARVLESEGEEFARAYEVQAEPAPVDDEGVSALWTELEQMESRETPVIVRALADVPLPCGQPSPFHHLGKGFWIAIPVLFTEPLKRTT